MRTAPGEVREEAYGQFRQLLKYEWKKIAGSRLSLLALVLSAGLLFGITMIEYIAVSPADRRVHVRERELEGCLLDDALLAEISREAERYGGIGNIGEESLYYHVAKYIFRMQGTYLTIGASGESGDGPVQSGLTAASLYGLREDLLEYIYDYFGLSEQDRQWWREREARIEKPFRWQANFGLYSMKSNFGAAMVLLTMITAAGLSGVYAGEKSGRTDALVLATKEGKRFLWIAKFAAGSLYALFAGCVLMAAVQLPHILFNGLHGWDAVYQLITPLSSYDRTAGQMLVLYLLNYFLGCLCTGAAVMLLSVWTGSAMFASGIVCVFAVMDLFLALPPKFGVLSTLRYLTPLQVLINSSMSDPRLLAVGGLRLPALYSAGFFYCLVTCACLAAVYRLYKRLEA